MFVKLNFTKNTKPIHIDNYIDALNSYVHRCLGKDNKYHDSFSGYNISSPQGGKLNTNTGELSFDNGMYFILSFPDKNSQIFSDLTKGITNGVEFGYGMKFVGVEILNINVGKEYDWIQTRCPVLLLSKKNNRGIRYDDSEFIEELTNRTIKKLKHYDENINLNGFKITIINTGKNKIKKVKIHNYNHKCNMIRMKIEGDKKTRKILYELGLGNLTGSGFGSLQICTKQSFTSTYET